MVLKVATTDPAAIFSLKFKALKAKSVGALDATVINCVALLAFPPVSTALTTTLPV